MHIIDSAATTGLFLLTGQILLQIITLALNGRTSHSSTIL